MPEHKIILTIDENGKITAETEGIKGETCLSELKELLDNQFFISTKKTDEFEQTTPIYSQNLQQNKKK
jgi:biopolymer transport protein ExbD